MALRGNFGSFRPSELLQYLAHSTKSGVLRVSDDDDVKFVAFRDGDLFFAVHQRHFPSLSDLVLHRGLTTPEKVCRSFDEVYRWDEVVSRALARRRLESDQVPTHRDRRSAKVVSTETAARVPAMLLAQGRLKEQDLEAAMEPEAIPDTLLASIISDAGLLAADELEGLQNGKEESLLSLVLEDGRVSREQITDAIAHLTDEALAELLAHQGHLSRSEAAHLLGQLQTLKVRAVPAVRLGEYLVTTGRVSQRNIEKALEHQLVEHKLLGEILVEAGHIKTEEVTQATEEIATLRADFGPLSALRRKLAAHGVHGDAFATVLEAQEETGRSLADLLAAHGKIDEKEIRRVIRKVLIDELCDLLLWSNASFEFFENLRIQDVFSARELPETHNYCFSAQTLLLAAHSELDELRERGFERLSLTTVLAPTGVERDPAAKDDPTTPQSRELLQHLDGVRSLREIRRLLPGNRFYHLRLFEQLIHGGLAEPLGRRDAFLKGEEARERGRDLEALDLYRHALESPGLEPSNSRLRTAIQEARLCGEKAPLRRLALRAKRALKACGETPPAKWVSRTIMSRLLKAKVVVEDFLIRVGVARYFWRLKAKIDMPVNWLIERLGHVPNHRLRGYTYTGILAFVVLAVWLAKSSEEIAVAAARPRPQVPATWQQQHSASSQHLVDALGAYLTPAPLEVPPATRGDRVYVAGRDGVLRCLRLRGSPTESPDSGTSDSNDSPFELLWEQKVGEFGDIVSRPVTTENGIFVSNVRGLVLSIAVSGEVLWTKKLSRMEPIPPRLLYDAESRLIGVAVVSSESVYVMSPQSGEILHRLQTGNRIVCQPTGDADMLFVGSGDNHIYRSAWRQGELLWEHEESDDVVALLLQRKVLVFATRNGHLGALDGDSGDELWTRAFPAGSITSLEEAPNGQVRIGLNNREFEIVALDSGETASEIKPDSELEVSVGRVHDNSYVYVDKRLHLGAIDVEGRILWRSREPVGDVSGWSCVDGGIAVTNREGKLVLFPWDSTAKDATSTDE